MKQQKQEIAFESKTPESVIFNLFRGNYVFVTVDDENANVIKILPNSTLLIKTSSGRTFKVETSNERVKYKHMKKDLEELGVAITLSDTSLHRALNRMLLAQDDDGMFIDYSVNVRKLIEMYKCLIEKPIVIHRSKDNTYFELILECVPENLYSKETYNKEQLQLFELLDKVTLTLRCCILDIPDTIGLDLKEYKHYINDIKDEILSELYKSSDSEDHTIYVFIAH